MFWALGSQDQVVERLKNTLNVISTKHRVLDSLHVNLLNSVRTEGDLTVIQCSRSAVNHNFNYFYV